jgi:hypothetical protein
MSRFDVSSLDANVLNQAIDDTNFPSSSSSSVTSTHISNGNGNDSENKTQPTSSALTSVSRTNVILNRAHPVPLKTFSDEVYDVPGTPRTPRTSTTPGIQNL